MASPANECNLIRRAISPITISRALISLGRGELPVAAATRRLARPANFSRLFIAALISSPLARFRPARLINGAIRQLEIQIHPSMRANARASERTRARGPTMTTCRSRSRRPTFDRDDNRERTPLATRGGGGRRKRETGERIATRYRQKAKATVSTGVIRLAGENDA